MSAFSTIPNCESVFVCVNVCIWIRDVRYANNNFAFWYLCAYVSKYGCVNIHILFMFYYDNFKCIKLKTICSLKYLYIYTWLQYIPYIVCVQGNLANTQKVIYFIVDGDFLYILRNINLRLFQIRNKWQFSRKYIQPLVILTIQ